MVDPPAPASTAGLEQTGHLQTARWRWLAVSVFVISSTLNYLDRLLLVFLAPVIIADLHITKASFGLLLSAFSLAYSGSSLLSGFLLDRFGVTRTATTAVAWWSFAALSTVWTRSLGQLAICRAALGMGESVGVPAAGKLNAGYLKPGERALGAAVNQVGLSLGGALAPLSAGLATAQGWRTPFVLAGALGFCWIPLWLAISRMLPPAYAPVTTPRRASSLTSAEAVRFLRSRNLLILALGTALWMGSYSLWSNWTPLYLANVYGLDLKGVARYAWIPPLVSNFGGFFGGWLSLRLARRGSTEARARTRAIEIATVCALSALFLQTAPSAGWATLWISSGYFFSLAGSVNLYALPIDLFGPAQTGFAISVLTCAFGIMQALLSPFIGFLADHHAYHLVTPLVTAPLVGCALLLRGLRLPPAASER